MFSASFRLFRPRLPEFAFGFALFVIASLPGSCFGGYNEKKLLNDLLSSYNYLERPVANESEPLQLSVGVSLQRIIDVDEKNQILITSMWLTLEWSDYSLVWDPAQYGNVSDLRIPPHRIWRPDLLLYNSADEQFDGTFATNVVVRHTGALTYVTPGIFKSSCRIDVTWFPFDEQKCEYKFGSWTYDGGQLNLSLLNPDDGADLSSYSPNGEWELIGMPGQRNAIYYACCPAPFLDITFVVQLRRRTGYYVNNLIIPCILVASLGIFGFALPPDSRERISLGVTILLSLTVFLNMVAETMPASSDATPIIAIFFNSIMFMLATSVISSILVVSLYFRRAETHGRMPSWARTLFLRWLPTCLFMRLPTTTTEDLIRDKSQSQSKNNATKENARMEQKQGDGDGDMVEDLRSVAESLHRLEKGRGVRAEWKFMAMVIDRICLITMSLFIIGATLALFKAVS